MTRDMWTGVLVVLSFLVIILVARVVWAVLVHDDWTCAIAKCVKVERIK